VRIAAIEHALAVVAPPGGPALVFRTAP
jgi:hypothetical protein